MFNKISETYVTGERDIDGCICHDDPVSHTNSGDGECDTAVGICLARHGVHTLPLCHSLQLQFVWENSFLAVEKSQYQLWFHQHHIRCKRPYISKYYVHSVISNLLLTSLPFLEMYCIICNFSNGKIILLIKFVTFNSECHHAGQLNPENV